MFTKTILAAALLSASLGAFAAEYYVVTPVKGKTFSQSAIAVTLNSYTLPGGIVGQAYAGFDFKSVLQVVNDPGFNASTVAWSVSSGVVPTGLTLDAATGVLSGTPTTQGSFPFSVQATYKTKTGIQNYTVAVGDITVALGTATIPLATVGQSFSYDLKANLSISGDPTPTPSSATWSVSPALPSWLTLSAAGVLSGTPSTPNTAGTSHEVTSVYKGRTAKQTYLVKVADVAPLASDYRLLLHVEGATQGSTSSGSVVDSSPSPIPLATMGPTGTVTIDNTTSALGGGSLKMVNTWGGASWGAAYAAYPVQSGGERRFAMKTLDFTVDAFVKSSSFGCYGAQYITYGQYDYANSVWTRSWSVETSSTGQLIFQVYNDNQTSAFKLTSTATMPTAAWNHIGVSRKAGTVRLFINGNQVASGTYAGNTELTRFYEDVPLVLGKPISTGNGCNTGVHNFDEVRVLKNFGATSLPVPTAPYVPGTN